MDVSFESEGAGRISALTANAVAKARALEQAMESIRALGDTLEQAKAYRNTVLTAMQALRAVVDELETLTATSFWPYPSYGDLLFSVK